MLTLDEVKDWLEITDSADDDRLEALMNRAIEAVQRELDWYFGEPRATSETLDGTGRASLYLRQPPADGEVAVYERTGPTYSWEVLETTEYENDGRGLHHRSQWTRGHRNYRADYLEGFDSPPGDVQQLTLDLIDAKWNADGHTGIRSESLGRYSYTLADLQELPQWATVRNNWKRGRI